MVLVSTQIEERGKAGSSEATVEPIEDIQPVVQDGLAPRTLALAKYLAKTEVHTYAFSVAANAILSLFPFIVLLLTVTRTVFHSRAMEGVVADMMRNFLPTGQDFVIRNMQVLAHPKKGTQLVLAGDAVDYIDGCVSATGSGAERRLGSDEEPFLFA